MLKECRASITLVDYGEHLISFTLSSPGKEFSPAAQSLPLYNILIVYIYCVVYIHVCWQHPPCIKRG